MTANLDPRKPPYFDTLSDKEGKISRIWLAYFQSLAIQIFSGAVNLVSGTAHRITVSGAQPLPVIDIAADYAGQSSISIVGPVTTGEWKATPVATAYIADHAITFPKFQQIATGKLVGRATAATGDVEQIDIGGGLALTLGALKIPPAGVTSAMLRDSNANSVIGRALNSSGVPGDITAVSNGDVLRLAAGILGFGDIPEASVSGLTADLAALAAAIAAKLTSTLPSGDIFVGNGSNVATAVAPSGDVTITNAGVTAIGANKVVTAKILDSNVTLPKIANQADQTILGNNSGAGGPPLALTATQAKALLAITESDVSGLVAALAAKLSTTLPSTEIFVGSAGNVATAVAVSGDAVIDVAGALTVDPKFGHWVGPITVPYTAFGYAGGSGQYGFAYGSAFLNGLVHMVKVRPTIKFTGTGTIGQVKLSTGKLDLTDANNYTPQWDAGDYVDLAAVQITQVNDLAGIAGAADLTVTLQTPGAGTLDTLTAGAVEISYFISRSP